MKRALVLGGLLAAVAALPATAQTEFGVSAGVYSSYVWRGLTLTRKPVFQPSAYLSFPIGSASLTVGGWANVDIGKYDKADDIAEGGGTSMNLAEFDPYAEIGYSLGKASMTWGITGYIYPNDAGLTSDFNTWEVYGKASLDAPLSPGIAAYYDIDKIKGLYVEGSLSHGVPLGATTLNLGATAGFDFGQDADLDDNDVPQADFYNFQEKGLTHVDLSASVDLAAGPVSITPSFHFQIDRDPFTKVRDLGHTDEDYKIWGGVSISWSKALGKAAEE